MIDDLVSKLRDVYYLLFADDVTIYKSGRNLRFVAEQIQQSLVVVQSRCEAWGFKVSVSKSQTIVFSYGHNRLPEP